MKLLIERLDGGGGTTLILDALERAGIELAPGSLVSTNTGVAEVKTTAPHTYLLRIDGERQLVHQRPFTQPVRDNEGHLLTAYTPHGYAWTRIEDMVRARKGWQAPLTADEVSFLKLDPSAVDTETGTWRFEDLTRKQLHQLATRNTG